MAIDRRELLAGAGILALAAPAALRAVQPVPAHAPSVPPGPPPPPTADRLRRERIASAAAANRQRLAYDGGTFAGAGWEMLVARGRAAQFFLLGEEHGIAENPKLAAQLFTTLAPAGYSRVAIEISGPMATAFDDALTEGGADALNRMLTAPESRVAFFGMREEAAWLAAARRAVPRGRFLWGTDYETAADRHLLAILRAKRKPAAAEAALARLEAASAAGWARYEATHDLLQIPAFSGDPALVQAVREAWPQPDAEADRVLDTLAETFAINRLWAERRGWESNERRGAFMRANFLRHWRAEKSAGRAPKVFLKYGASHMVRGRNHTETFDLGSLLPEIAALEGGHAFHLLVLPGAGSPLASIDPATFTYTSSNEQGTYVTDLEPILSQAYPDAMTLFDTHALRPLLGSSRTPATADLMRAVHGFDAILVMTGSTASSNL
jgi:hypothetical protein